MGFRDVFGAVREQVVPVPIFKEALPKESYEKKNGLVVEKVTSLLFLGQVLVQFKLKWLVQDEEGPCQKVEVLAVTVEVPQFDLMKLLLLVGHEVHDIFNGGHLFRVERDDVSLEGRLL